MPSPTSALSTLRPDLTDSFQEFDLEIVERGMIAYQVAPIVEVAKASGTFGKIPVEQLLQARDTSRAPGSNYNRGNWRFTPATFATEEHGLEEPIDDNEAAMYADFFNAEVVAALRARAGVLIEAEKRVEAAIFNTTTWTGSTLTTAITNEWDDPANATPIKDVRDAAKRVFDNSGLWPNALVINEAVFRNVLACDQITGLLKYQGFQDVRAGVITAQALAAVFNLDRVLVGGLAENTANEGQSASLASVWSDEYAMVCRVATSQDPREPCIARTFHWSEDGSEPAGTVETYRDETIRGDVVRVRHQVDEVVLYAEAGHLLSNVTT